MDCIILDAHISPTLAVWISENFNLPCYSLTYLDMQKASDRDIYEAARGRNAVIITKDTDFLNLHTRFGAPPKVIWLTCGNTTKQRLKEIFTLHLSQALQALSDNDLVEISGN